MSRIFTIESRDGQSAARSGTLHLPHGDVKTPVFMPVGTAATVKALRHVDVARIGYSLILANTYHLVLRPGLDVIGSLGGLHRFSGWTGNILTDSGGYQVFSLPALRKIGSAGVEFASHIDGSRHLFTPESVVDAQVVFGSDVQMALDVCTAPGVTHEAASDALVLTTEWATRAAQRWRERRESGYEGVLFGIVQGNFFADLRERSAAEITALDLPGIAIGGLSVGESPELFRRTLFDTARHLPDDRPHYLMGIGTPDYIFDAVTAGIDMFDCVFPTRIARNGTVLTWDGRVVLKHESNTTFDGPIDPECSCSACTTYSRAYLRHLFKSGEMLGPILTTEHNLWFLHELLERIRESIRDGRFTAFRDATMGRYQEGERERLSSR